MNGLGRMGGDKQRRKGRRKGRKGVRTEEVLEDRGRVGGGEKHIPQRRWEGAGQLGAEEVVVEEAS